MTPHIVGLGGSLRAASASLSALRVALDGAAAAGATVETLDVRELDLPLYDDGARASPGVDRLVEGVGRADGMIWSSPLYHGTVSGAFKNALDWLQLLNGHEPPFLTGTPVGLVATAGGVQGLQAINTMEYVVRALRGWTVPFVVPVAHAYQSFADDGTPRDQALAARLAMLGQEVVAASRRFAA
jgi:FMN reductase